MSTFAGTLNAAQAYVVNDIYLRLKPKSTNNQIKRANYFVGIVTVIVSIIIGFFAQDVNSILQWIVSALWGSYVASNVLKWYWWRFNGHGYFWGMLAGLIPALIFPTIFNETLELYYFPLLLLIAIIGCIAGTFMRPATDEATLKKFYSTVRPWGFWKPIHKLVIAENPDFQKNTNFYRDMFNVVMGIIAQTALVALPIFLLIKKFDSLLITVLSLLIVIIILKKTWYDKLEEA
jgi:hypothetical protein